MHYLAVVPPGPAGAADEADAERPVAVVPSPEVGHQVGALQLPLCPDLKRLECVQRRPEPHVVVPVRYHKYINDVCTEMGFITSQWLREYEVKKLPSPVCCGQDNAIFSRHIHATSGK